MDKESRVDVMYMYKRVQEILSCDSEDDMAYAVSRLSDELAKNYVIDTGRKIGQDLEENK
jgi:hypothetical protein